MGLLWFIGLNILFGWIAFSIFLSNFKMAHDHYKDKKYDFMSFSIIGALASPLAYLLGWIVSLMWIQAYYFVETGALI